MNKHTLVLIIILALTALLVGVYLYFRCNRDGTASSCPICPSCPTPINRDALLEAYFTISPEIYDRIIDQYNSKDGNRRGNDPISNTDKNLLRVILGIIVTTLQKTPELNHIHLIEKSDDPQKPAYVEFLGNLQRIGTTPEDYDGIKSRVNVRSVVESYIGTSGAPPDNSTDPDNNISNTGRDIEKIYKPGGKIVMSRLK